MYGDGVAVAELTQVIQHDGLVVQQRRDVDQVSTTTATVAVVGLGYVGLPTSIALAHSGIRVVGYDISVDRIQRIRADDVDLLDVDRQRLAALGCDGLFTMTHRPSALAAADFVIICVPTPVTHHREPDLEPLRQACQTFVQHARAGQTVIMTSTTYVGCTNDFIVQPLIERGFAPGNDIHVVFSPERIDPGVPEHRPDVTPRICGGYTPRCSQQASTVLAATAQRINTVSSLEVAEMSKLLENTFRAVNIAMVNEFADAAREYGIDPIEVIDAAATKPYGFMRFTPGPGVGGHCIPCDPHYLLWELKSRSINLPVIDAAMKGIAQRPRTVVDRAVQELAKIGVPIGEATVHVVGIAYKPGVEDLRESTALEIMSLLGKLVSHVEFSDPLVNSYQRPDGTTLSACDGAASQADLYLVHTIHPDVDYSWLAHKHHVLDCTYRAAVAAPHCVQV